MALTRCRDDSVAARRAVRGNVLEAKRFEMAGGRLPICYSAAGVGPVLSLLAKYHPV